MAKERGLNPAEKSKNSGGEGEVERGWVLFDIEDDDDIYRLQQQCFVTAKELDEAAVTGQARIGLGVKSVPGNKG